MKIAIEVKDEHIEQALSGAFDSGGIAYWARVKEARINCASVTEGRNLPYIAMWGYVQLEYADINEDADTPTPARLDREAIARGLALMAEWHQNSFRMLCEGQADKYVGDTLVQLAVFGKLVFG